MATSILSDVEWEIFTVDLVFSEIKNSKAYHKSNLQEMNNGIPYVSRTNLNNGLESIMKYDRKFVKNPANTIVFGAENADFFYQSFEYITGNKMYYIVSDNFNRYTGLFVKMMLSNSIKNCGFGYGKGLTGTRMKNRTILLPVTISGQPHREFMENYMKDIEKNLLEKANTYLESTLKKQEVGGWGGGKN